MVRTSRVRQRSFAPLFFAIFLCLLCSASSLQAQGTLGSQQRSQKISALEGGFVGPLNDQDFFGVSCQTIGDVDADGNDDIAVGARGNLGGGGNPGAVWILFMNSDGTVRAESMVTPANGVFGSPSQGDLSGTAIGALGDLDGDGVPDIAVGDPSAQDGGPSRGAFLIFFLNSDGSVKFERRFSSTVGGFGGPLDDGDLFGSSLAVLDPSTPGAVVDLALGAAGDDDGGADRGALWVLSLSANGSILAEAKIAQGSGGFAGTLADGDAFGTSVAALGDVDCDGFDDLVVGAERDDEGGNGAGAVWVLFRDATGGVDGEQKIAASSGGFSGPLAAGDNFGSGVATLGDLDLDGNQDIAVGAPGDDDGGTDRGAVWLLFLNKDATVRDALKLSDADPGFQGNLDDGDFFGSALGFSSDLDDNGLPELLVGTPDDDDGGVSTGAAYVVFFQFPAQTICNGSGINPVALQAGTNPPQIGGVWDPMIDSTLVPLLGGANFHVIGVSSQPITTGVTFGSGVAGELLISLPDLQLSQSVAPGQNFAIGIPLNVVLVGMDCYSQGVIVEDDLLTLTNRLDVVIGFPPASTTVASPPALPSLGKARLDRGE